jgi:hypothetical protein
MFKSGKPDRCGVTLLAGRAAGAPFVGAVAANLVVTELPRLLHGGTYANSSNLMTAQWSWPSLAHGADVAANKMRVNCEAS